MTVVSVIDAIATFLPLAEGMKLDDSLAEPARILPNRLYIWPRRLAPQRLNDEDGRWDEADLRLRVLYVLPAKGESRGQKRDRDVSVELDAAVDAIQAAVDANKRGRPLWWDMYLETIVYDAVRSIDARGAGVDICVRLNPGATAPATGSGS